MSSKLYFIWAWEGLTSFSTIKQGVLSIEDQKLQLYFDPVSERPTFTLSPQDTSISVTADFLIIKSTQLSSTNNLLRVSLTNTYSEEIDQRFLSKFAAQPIDTGARIGIASMKQMQNGSVAIQDIASELRAAGFNAYIKHSFASALIIVAVFSCLSIGAVTLLLISSAALKLPTIVNVLGAVLLLIGATLGMVKKLYS